MPSQYVKPPRFCRAEKARKGLKMDKDSSYDMNNNQKIIKEPVVVHQVCPPQEDPSHNGLEHMMERMKLHSDLPPVKPIEQNHNFMMEKLKLQQMLFERMIQWQRVVQDRFAVRLQQQREAEHIQQIQRLEVERLQHQLIQKEEMMRQIQREHPVISIDVSVPPPPVFIKMPPTIQNVHVHIPRCNSNPQFSCTPVNNKTKCLSSRNQTLPDLPSPGSQNVPILPLRRQFKSKQEFQKAKRWWLQWHCETSFSFSSPSSRHSNKESLSPIPFDHMVLLMDYLPFYSEDQIDSTAAVVETVEDPADLGSSFDDDIIVIT